MAWQSEEQVLPNEFNDRRVRKALERRIAKAVAKLLKKFPPPEKD